MPTLFCIGRNYIAHAQELKNEVPDEPVIFLKPSSSLIKSGGAIQLPKDLGEIHHEVEIVVQIGSLAKCVSETKALQHISGIAIGIDVTARELQEKLKQKRLPWALAKGLDTFAPVGKFIDAKKIEDFSNISFELEINGTIRQKGNTGDMIFSIARLIAWLSQYFTLLPGDLIFTGTPKGVGQIHSGDRLKARISGFSEDLEITAK